MFSADVDVNVQFPPATQLPMNASIYLIYGDGTKSSPIPISAAGLLNGGMNFTHRYTSDGDFIITVVIENMASKMVFNVSVSSDPY